MPNYHWIGLRSEVKSAEVPGRRWPNQGFRQFPPGFPRNLIFYLFKYLYKHLVPVPAVFCYYFLWYYIDAVQRTKSCLTDTEQSQFFCNSMYLVWKTKITAYLTHSFSIIWWIFKENLPQILSCDTEINFKLYSQLPLNIYSSSKVERMLTLTSIWVLQQHQPWLASYTTTTLLEDRGGDYYNELRHFRNNSMVIGILA